MHNTIQVGQVHRISSTRVFNADKEGVTMTLSFVVNAPTETADKVLQLADQRAPIYIQVGTLQERMPLKEAPAQTGLPATDPQASPPPHGGAEAKASKEEKTPLEGKKKD